MLGFEGRGSSRLRIVNGMVILEKSVPSFWSM